MLLALNPLSLAAATAASTDRSSAPPPPPPTAVSPNAFSPNASSPSPSSSPILRPSSLAPGEEGNVAVESVRRRPLILDDKKGFKKQFCSWSKSYLDALALFILDCCSDLRSRRIVILSLEST